MLSLGHEAQDSWTWRGASCKGGGGGGGVPSTVFVYEILRWYCIHGSWWKKGLNEKKWAPGGKWKTALEERAIQTRVLGVYIGLGRYTPMHSSAHGGLTRSGFMLSRLT